MSLLKYFEYRHLPEHLVSVSKPFAELVAEVDGMDVADERERAVAMRKLLEAKDAAVRSCV